MRRTVTTLLAVWLVAASLLALVPAVSAAGPGLAGTWTSTDSDGSRQRLTVGRGSTPAVTYIDFYASSCDNAGAASTEFVATGRGIVDGDLLSVAFRNGGCGRHKIGPFELGFAYDAGNGTLTDDFGITWSRVP